MKSFLASMILYSMGCLTSLAQRTYPVPQLGSFGGTEEKVINHVKNLRLVD